MINLKKFALGLLTIAATATTASPANAGFVVDGIPFMDEKDFPAQAHGIVGLLYDLEVPIVDGGKLGVPDCKPQEDGYLMGYYDMQENYMLLCTNNGTQKEITETLIHEAVHTVQDCRAGLQNDRSRVGAGTADLWNRLSKQHHEEIIEFYPEEQHLHEVEARFFEQNPQAVEGGLRQFCF
jgi:hypothetical protein